MSNSTVTSYILENKIQDLPCFRNDSMELTTNYVVSTLYLQLVFIGLFSNCFFLWVSIIQKKETLTESVVYLRNLAINDILLLLVFNSTNILESLRPLKATLGIMPCKLLKFIDSTLIGVNVFTLSSLNCSRYLNINSHHHHNHKSISATKCYLKVGAIWMCGILFASPILLFAEELPFPDEKCIWEYVCFSIYNGNYPKSSEIYTLLQCFVYGFVPCILNVYWNRSTSSKLKKSIEYLKRINHNNEYPFVEVIILINRNRLNFTKMLACSTAMFVIAYLPTYVYKVFNLYLHDLMFTTNDFIGFITYVAVETTYYLFFLNNCLNPLQMLFVSRIYRKELLKAFETTFTKMLFRYLLKIPNFLNSLVYDENDEQKVNDDKFEVKAASETDFTTDDVTLN